MKSADSPRLFCDVMLGKLARRLRLLGVDVRYERGVKRIEAYRRAKAEGRMFLTRHHRFKSMPDVIYINSDKVNEQVEQVREFLRMKPSEKREVEGGFLSRCSVCNEPLSKISREQARPAIPFYIYQIHTQFRRCPKCQRVYWPGSHIKRMIEQGGK
ncbi:MAG: Mut7-C RNAse domain-containing protein [candidate division WOR-3 bacterium]